MRQEIKRIDTALRTHDRTALADDDLLDVAGRRCCRSRGNRMKERENREFWIRQTTALLAMSINRYLYIYLYCYCRVASGSAESGPPPEPKRSKGRLCPCPAPQDRIS